MSVIFCEQNPYLSYEDIDFKDLFNFDTYYVKHTYRYHVSDCSDLEHKSVYLKSTYKLEQLGMKFHFIDSVSMQ